MFRITAFSLLSLATIAFPVCAPAQSLNTRVLIVYNTNSASSLEVANYYRTQRAITTPLCGVAFTHTEQVLETTWTSTVRPAIRACLDAAGRANILYVVLAQETPFLIVRDANRKAALDSYIADIWDAHSAQAFPVSPAASHRYYLDAQTLGNAYAPFLSLATYRSQPRSSLIYSVWRLDGSSAAIAKGLVDKAMQAEANGWMGSTYFDRVHGPNLFQNNYDLSYFSGDFDLYQAGQMATSAGMNPVIDTNPAEFGTAPAPLTAPNAKFYAGWYSLHNYNDAFTWNPGAIGLHLDSASAAHLRFGPSWVANAIQRGITVTAGSVDEPFLEGLPHPDVVLRHLLQGGNVGDAMLRATSWLKWMVVNVGDPLYRPQPGGAAPFNAPLFENTLRLTPRGVLTGTSSRVDLELQNAAPTGGLTLTIYNSYPAEVTGAPATVFIPAGQRTASFTLNTQGITQLLAVEVRATAPGLMLRNTLIAVPLLASVQAGSNVMVGGTTSQGAVTLYGRAPLNGSLVTLSCSHPALLQVPASVTVPLGAQIAVFPITTTAVAATTKVTITATLLGATETFDVFLTP